MQAKKWDTKTFKAKIKENLPQIKFEVGFKLRTVDNRITVNCPHGTSTKLGWQLLSQKYCCRKGYHESWNKLKKKNRITLEDRKTEISKYFSAELLDVSLAQFDSSSQNREKISNLRCIEHNLVFSQWLASLQKGIGCPACGKRNKQEAGRAQCYRMKRDGKMHFVSKAETIWLDSLEVPQRQVWLSDIKYCVDGYDPVTNTVFLYHGKFWHGDPSKFPSDMIHPIRKNLTMGELYNATLNWESKIKEAGYKLVTIWR